MSGRAPIRVLDDLSNSLEFRYAKPARGLVVEALDAAAAASAERRLAEILVACVDAGASVYFLPPLAMAVARGFWRKVATDVARGERVLLAAWLDGALVGTAQLGLDMPENQPHRADVAKVLVDPAARRAGIGRALMQRIERRHAAMAAACWCSIPRAMRGRSSTARRAGRRPARIPGFALDGHGGELATIFFWKRV